MNIRDIKRMSDFPLTAKRLRKDDGIEVVLLNLTAGICTREWNLMTV